MAKVEINEGLCKRCGLCEAFCPRSVFGEKGKIMQAEKCAGCGHCLILCPERAVSFPDADADTVAEGMVVRPPSRGGWTKRDNEVSGPALLSGNEACARAALDCGCRFFAGYPITPASEIMYEMVVLDRLPDGAFIQMEDEISSIAAVIGASWAGKKAMTATSGPGFSLMQENIGYAVITETPCVIVDVQRVGPSTGQATRPAASDLLQAVWGSHGDSPKIVLAPASVQDCYELTVEAFNWAEIYRTPVILLLDEIVAHTRERIEVPREIHVFDRIYVPGEFPFGPSAVAEKMLRRASMPKFGDGEGLTITGSTHRPDGTRAASDPRVQQEQSDYLARKINSIDFLSPADWTDFIECDRVFIAMGSVCRSIKQAIRRRGRTESKAGLIELKRVWPFPFAFLKKIPLRADIIVVEMNQGQLIHLVREVFPRANFLGQNNGLAIEPKKIEAYLKGRGW